MAKEDAEDTIKSPCTRHCTLNEDDICVGCFRSLNDILNWQTSSNQEKADIVEKALKRQQ
jgi:predicted Fe-S protein YdhL (DUF1289 family)